MVNFWLVKSEPVSYSWQQMRQDQTTSWDGVRNFQARNNLREMKVGDLSFFYHSNQERRIMGIIKVVKDNYYDESDSSKKFVTVDFRYVSDLKRPINLSEVKANPKLSKLALVTQPRLSVMPLTKLEWDYILQLAAS